jgi:hypothetical protein
MARSRKQDDARARDSATRFVLGWAAARGPD